MKIFVEMEVDVPSETPIEVIEEDLKKAETQIGWDFDFHVNSVMKNCTFSTE